MLNFLGPTPSQHLLSTDETRVLRTIVEPHTVIARGGDICGSASKHVHLLLQGWAAKYKVSLGGRRQLASLHLNGEICDLDRLFCPDLTYSVQALTDCRVARIAIADLMRVADEHLPLRNLFWSLIAMENVALVEHVARLGCRNSRERMAHFFCDIISRLQPRGLMYGNGFRLEMTQSELAECLGTSLVHTNRTLRSLADEKIIETRGRHYTILDLPRLKAMAGDHEAMEKIAWRSYEASSVLQKSINDRPADEPTHPSVTDMDRGVSPAVSA